MSDLETGILNPKLVRLRSQREPYAISTPV